MKLRKIAACAILVCAAAFGASPVRADALISAGSKASAEAAPNYEKLRGLLRTIWGMENDARLIKKAALFADSMDRPGEPDSANAAEYRKYGLLSREVEASTGFSFTHSDLRQILDRALASLSRQGKFEGERSGDVSSPAKYPAFEELSPGDFQVIVDGFLEEKSAPEFDVVGLYGLLNTMNDTLYSETAQKDAAERAERLLKEGSITEEQAAECRKYGFTSEEISFYSKINLTFDDLREILRRIPEDDGIKAPDEYTLNRMKLVLLQADSLKTTVYEYIAQNSIETPYAEWKTRTFLHREGVNGSPADFTARAVAAYSGAGEKARFTGLYVFIETETRDYNFETSLARLSPDGRTAEQTITATGLDAAIADVYKYKAKLNAKGEVEFTESYEKTALEYRENSRG
ncbi:MAG: hypothetical protein LBU36_08365 [Clostridiales bacterium]|jgi:hypothetical protein|nr:hypothetical protein [Clostridiales bacterium]